MTTQNKLRDELPFSVAEGLAIQQKQLSEWKHKLTEGYFELVQQEAIKQNSKTYTSGWDVWRGNDIANFVHNLP